MIHLTPVIQYLELEKFGLEYIDCDPLAFATLPNEISKTDEFIKFGEEAALEKIGGIKKSIELG